MTRNECETMTRDLFTEEIEPYLGLVGTVVKTMPGLCPCVSPAFVL